LLGLLGAMALTTETRATLTDGMGTTGAQNNEAPYRGIWLRNVFDLKPTPAQLVETANTEPPPNIKLTGITTILGNKQALFMVQAAAERGKPAGPEQSYILSEGQRRGVLEVVEINPKTATVKIKNEGVLSTITFPSNNVSGASQKIAGAGLASQLGFHRAANANPGFSSANAVENAANTTPPGLAPQTAYNTSETPFMGGYFGGYIGGVATPVATPSVPAPNVAAQTPAPVSNPSPPDVMSQTAAALAQAQARAASEGRSLMPEAPVSEVIPELPAPAQTVATGSSPSRPQFLTPPPVPNLPAPPTLPASLQPH